MNHDWRDSTFLQTRLLFVLRLFLPFGQYILGLLIIDVNNYVSNYIFWCVITIHVQQIVLQKNVEFQKDKGICLKAQSFIQYFVVPDQISNIGYLRISGNKWHVKFALSFIILQEYTRLSITKWRPLQYQLDMCLWNTDAPAATKSKYGKHI